VKNNETMKILSYAYATTAPGGVVPTREQGFYFWRDVLVGHNFTSSFPEDKTDFDATKAQPIRKGETTESAVVALLGRPHGIYAYPLISDKDARAAVYLYQETKGTAFNLKFYHQILVVQFDPAGAVKEVGARAGTRTRPWAHPGPPPTALPLRAARRGARPRRPPGRPARRAVHPA
jgi:hypothetical protein